MNKINKNQIKIKGQRTIGRRVDNINQNISLSVEDIVYNVQKFSDRQERLIKLDA